MDIGLIVTIVIAVVGWAFAIADRVTSARNREQDADQHKEELRQKDEQHKKELAQKDREIEALREANTSLRRLADSNPRTANPWDKAEWTGDGYLFEATNHGSTPVTVTRVESARSDYHFDLHSDVPSTVNPGGSIVYVIQSFWQSGGSPTVNITWHRDDGIEHVTSLTSIKPQ